MAPPKKAAPLFSDVPNLNAAPEGEAPGPGSRPSGEAAGVFESAVHAVPWGWQPAIHGT